jgi:peptidylprolyl isomerase
MRAEFPRRALVAPLIAALTLPPDASATTSSMRVNWGPFKELSVDEMQRLDALSRTADAGVVLPSGVRVIDLVQGDGPRPQIGDRVYVQYKVWADGFREGKAADVSFFDNRPFDWILGDPPSDRIPKGADLGVVGMREGGWRRVVVPGDLSFTDGLRKINRGPTGRYTGAKAPYVIQPRSPTYWDLILVDGGSGRCEKLLRPPGVSERDAKKLKSLTCSYANEIY